MFSPQIPYRFKKLEAFSVSCDSLCLQTLSFAAAVAGFVVAAAVILVVVVVATAVAVQLDG